jgi:cation diffusion facilitator family transporter
MSVDLPRSEYAESAVHHHAHGAVDQALLATRRGLWAVKWSFLGLMATAVFQVFIALISGSVALLADTVHNFGDAATAIPLWAAFKTSRWPPTRRFTYGYGRVEDLAGLAVLFAILLTALFAGYESFERLIRPQEVGALGAVAVASIVGFLGNEAVAVFRIKVGNEIGSAALVADGYHARIDGLTSLTVLFGVVGVWLGYPLADPIIGLVITGLVLVILWRVGKEVFGRMLDGVDPEVVAEIEELARGTPGVLGVSEVRVRWLGHRLHAEVNLAVGPRLSVEEGHAIAGAAHQALLQQLRYLSSATIHVDPAGASGEEHHRIAQYEHGGISDHPH